MIAVAPLCIMRMMCVYVCVIFAWVCVDSSVTVKDRRREKKRETETNKKEEREG